MSLNYTQLAKQFDISEGAIQHMAAAMQVGNGTQAQFNHPELGGMGQWMPGMVMIGDAFNNQLKAKVMQIAEVLQGAYTKGDLPPIRMTPMSQMSSQWWADDMGTPSMAGGQNETQYAVFYGKQRLLIKDGNTEHVYDTGKHHITGVSQAQGNGIRSLVFKTALNKSLTVDDLTEL
ncbi:MAG: hypothetical protein AAFQ07_05645 [Chloroflexota bacterium]